MFDGVPKATISRTEYTEGVSIMDALVAISSFLASNGEAKRELKANAIAVNKEKVNETYSLTNNDLINDKFVLIGKGKKTNYLLIVEN